MEMIKEAEMRVIKVASDIEGDLSERSEKEGRERERER
jgi:hypothetical protein